MSEQLSDGNLIKPASQPEFSQINKHSHFTDPFGDEEAIAAIQSSAASNVELEIQQLSNVELEIQQLAVKTQKIKLEEQKARLTEQKIKLEAFKKEITFSRKLKLVQHSLRGTGGIVMLITGIVFTGVDKAIGPYVMGIGAALASVSVKETVELARSVSTMKKKKWGELIKR